MPINPFDDARGTTLQALLATQRFGKQNKGNKRKGEEVGTQQQAGGGKSEKSHYQGKMKKGLTGRRAQEGSQKENPGDYALKSRGYHSPDAGTREGKNVRKKIAISSSRGYLAFHRDGKLKGDEK